MNLDRKPAPGTADDPTTSNALPHEQDQQASPPKEDAQHRHNRKPIAQAHDDVESGLRDTERIGTPNDVPTSGSDRGRR